MGCHSATVSYTCAVVKNPQKFNQSQHHTLCFTITADCDLVDDKNRVAFASNAALSWATRLALTLGNMGCGAEGSCVVVIVSYWVLHCCAFHSCYDFFFEATVHGSFSPRERDPAGFRARASRAKTRACVLSVIILQRLKKEPGITGNRVDVKEAPTVVCCTALTPALVVGRRTRKNVCGSREGA